MHRFTLPRQILIVALIVASVTQVWADDDPLLRSSVGVVEVYTIDTFEQPHLTEQGTVFLVSMEGDLLTARHVVAPTKHDYEISKREVPEDLTPKRQYRVWFGSPQASYYAELGDCGGEEVDVCLLKIRPVEVKLSMLERAFSLFCGKPAPNDEIISYGIAPGIEVDVKGGKITSERNQRGKYQSDVQIAGGMSGGPVTHRGRAYAVHMGAVDKNVTLLQPLFRFWSQIENAGIKCPKDVSSNRELSSGTPPAAKGGAASRSQLASEFANDASISETDPQSPSCEEIIKSYRLRFGPDTEPRVHGFYRFIDADPGCELVDYSYSLPSLLAFTNWSAKRSSDRTHYDFNFEFAGSESEQNFALDIQVAQKRKGDVQTASLDSRLVAVSEIEELAMYYRLRFQAQGAGRTEQDRQSWAGVFAGKSAPPTPFGGNAARLPPLGESALPRSDVATVPANPMADPVIGPRLARAIGAYCPTMELAIERDLFGTDPDTVLKTFIDEVRPAQGCRIVSRSLADISLGTIEIRGSSDGSRGLLRYSVPLQPGRVVKVRTSVSINQAATAATLEQIGLAFR